MKDSLESLGRLRLQALVMLAVVFVIGALTGAAVERARRPHPPRPPQHQGLPREMCEELHLTPPQIDRIDGILASNRPRTDAVLDQFLPQLRALTDSIRAEVRTVLTPEQQQLFDHLEPPLLPPALSRPPKGGAFRGPPPDGPLPSR
jgi:Spy/CpxP family protein refolding chaperone